MNAGNLLRRIRAVASSGPGWAAAFVGVLIGLSVFAANSLATSVLFALVAYIAMLCILTLA
jgi:hypothetical protein